MWKRSILSMAGMALAGLTLAGCQSSDSGSGSRMLSRQSDPYSRPPMNSMASAMPGNKSLGITDTNTRPSMMPTANSIQQANAMQTQTSTSATMPASNSNSVSSFDQAGAVVSRPMGGESTAVPPGPTPLSPPGGYTIPTPTTYSPPANPSVPTRKPGDDQ